MKKNYELIYRLITCMLLLTLFLQSCDGFSKQLNFSEKEPLDISLRAISQLDITPLLDKKLTAEKGYLVIFHENQGELKADVWVDEKQKGPSYRNLPVRVEEQTDLERFHKLDSKTQQQRVQLKFSQKGTLYGIFILKGGLSGGMMEGDDYQEKEREQERKKEVTVIRGSSLEEIDVWEKSHFNKFLPAISEQEIHYGEELARGGFGVVYKAIYQKKTVAVKKLLRTSNEQIAALQKEAVIMSNHRHKNIVSFLGFCSAQNALVMEYVSSGSLWNLLKSSEDIPWQVRFQIGLDVAEGVRYLHDCGVVHSDLTSNNILLARNSKGEIQAKITDFGISALKREHSTSGISSYGDRLGWSFRWMAPEIFHTDKNTKAGDVYSYGMILWQLGARKQPFAEVKEYQIPLYVTSGNCEAISEDTPLEIRKVIELC